jgi:hypothetical protein
MRPLKASLPLVFLALLGTNALAAEAGTTKEPTPGCSVEMPYLIAPVVVDDKLIAYAYVSSKIIAASPSAAIVVRDKIPFVQDAFVRDVNSAPIGKPADLATVDADALVARLFADARRIVGSNEVVGIRIIQIQISPLRSAPQG